MRYLGSGVFDSSTNYLFDSTDFSILSYFIFFDNTAQQIDLAGYMDESDVDFSYVNWDYKIEFDDTIAPTSDVMFGFLCDFSHLPDFSPDPSQDSTNKDLQIKLLHFIDRINYYNKQSTKYLYFDHDYNHTIPFAELIVIKIGDTIVKAMLKKFITKYSLGSVMTYTLNHSECMNRFIYHYSTTSDDYDSVYLKLLYNKRDYETINKEELVISPKLQPLVNSDSSKLYVDVTIDSTVVDLVNKYSLFNTSIDEILYINNKYLCHIVDIVDTTATDGTYYTSSQVYTIEFLDFDSTDDLDTYMGGITYYDFSKIIDDYYFNIRTIKKLNNEMSLYSDPTIFFDNRVPFKTLYGIDNLPANQTATTQAEFLQTSLLGDPIKYSGIYDSTNNSYLQMKTFLTSFRSKKYAMPFDTTIDLTTIENSISFYIDLFVDNTADYADLLSRYVTNGIAVYEEGLILDAVLLKVEQMSILSENTIRVGLRTLIYDEEQFLDQTGLYYTIPADSYLILYKYHVFNVVPYIDFSRIDFNNNISNLITAYMFSYSASNPSSLSQNGYIIDV